MRFAMRSPRSSALIFRCNPPDILLEVTDNGSGIADSQAASGEGFGFSNMRARAENIGAHLNVRTASGRGITIVVNVPMNV
jgi:signal transduction histidine kinase